MDEIETKPGAEAELPESGESEPVTEPIPAPDSDVPPGTGEETTVSDDGDAFRKQAEDDLQRLKEVAPEAAGYCHLGEMPGALRFAELRELGLSVEEAYYAVRGAGGAKPVPDRGGRAHLHGSVPGRAATGGVGMTAGEIEAARRLFPGLPDREIASLYRRVNETR